MYYYLKVARNPMLTNCQQFSIKTSKHKYAHKLEKLMGEAAPLTL